MLLSPERRRVDAGPEVSHGYRRRKAVGDSIMPKGPVDPSSRPAVVASASAPVCHCRFGAPEACEAKGVRWVGALEHGRIIARRVRPGNLGRVPLSLG